MNILPFYDHEQGKHMHNLQQIPLASMMSYVVVNSQWRRT